MSNSTFYTFRVFVKGPVEQPNGSFVRGVVHSEDTDLGNVEAVKARLRLQYPNCEVREKQMQNG